jgi:hypothetical protein
MIIVTFADKGYEPYVKNLYKSFKVKKDFFIQDKFVFYGIDYLPELKGDNVYNYKFTQFKPVPKLNFWKPHILIDLLSKFPEEDNFCFIDADVLIGKRLDFDKLLQNKSFNYPLSPTHNIHEIPFCWASYPNGVTFHHTTNGLCEYFNIPVKAHITPITYIEGNSCPYTQTCIMLYNRKHLNFLLEWASMCEYEFLWGPDSLVNYPYQDETAFNVLLWKYNSTETLSPIYVNTHTFEAYKKGEETTELTNQDLIEGHNWSRVYDINILMLYHGYKDLAESKKVIDYIDENLPS